MTKSSRHVLLLTDSYFDGSTHHARGAYLIELIGGRIHKIARRTNDITSGDDLQINGKTQFFRAPFGMPGLAKGLTPWFQTPANWTTKEAKLPNAPLKNNGTRRPNLNKIVIRIHMVGEEGKFPG